MRLGRDDIHDLADTSEQLTWVNTLNPWAIYS